MLTLEHQTFVSDPKGGWVRLSAEDAVWISENCRFERVVELGAGSGHVASMLTDAGMCVVCFDTKLPGTYQENWRSNDSVHTGGIEEAMEELKRANVLLCCWPPQEADFFANALKAFRGEFVVYIGEDEGGLTGNSNMFSILGRDWVLVKRRELQNFRFMFGFINIFIRRPQRFCCWFRYHRYPFQISLELHAQRMLEHDMEFVTERGGPANLDDTHSNLIWQKIQLCQNLQIATEQVERFRHLMLLRWNNF